MLVLLQKVAHRVTIATNRTNQAKFSFEMFLRRKYQCYKDTNIGKTHCHLANDLIAMTAAQIMELIVIATMVRIVLITILNVPRSPEEGLKNMLKEVVESPPIEFRTQGIRSGGINIKCPTPCISMGCDRIINI